jgi:beta-galactosidase
MKPYFAAALACLTLPGLSLAAEGIRGKLNFNPDWKFIKADPAGAAEPSFDD